MTLAQTIHLSRNQWRALPPKRKWHQRVVDSVLAACERFYVEVSAGLLIGKAVLV